MFDVVTLGEAMIRLSPPNYKRLEQATSLDLVVGGTELSVAIGVSRLGMKSSWVSKVPNGPLGRLIVNKARELGVDTNHVVWTDEGRAGIYYVEFGASPRPSAVIYDRKYSAASMMKPGEIDWSFLKDVKLFHTTGITPALSPTAREATLEAIDAAKKAGCKISMDINYRAKLWSTKEAEATMTPLTEKLDVLFTTDEDTWRVWNMKGTPEEIITGLKDRFHIPVVAITIREIVTVLKNRWSSMVYADKIYKSKRVYDVEIVDRIGSGDSFAAGFIYGYLNGDIQMGVDYGDVMAAYKHSIPGDSNYMAKDEVDQAVKATSDLRIQR